MTQTVRAAGERPRPAWRDGVSPAGGRTANCRAVSIPVQ